MVEKSTEVTKVLGQSLEGGVGGHPGDPLTLQKAEEDFEQRRRVNVVGRVVDPRSQIQVPKDLKLIKTLGRGK